MNYIRQILLPEEEVLYDGHVHPRVLVPGMLFLGLAAIILIMGSNNDNHSDSWLLHLIYRMSDSFSSLYGLYQALWKLQQHSPHIALETKILAMGLAGYGITHFCKQLVVMQTTELVITNMRVIAKIGLFTITTLELDRRRIAGVSVYQTFMGRIMNYGYVFIEGFTASITGLPIMANPHLVEKFLS
jgi:hypothetical protein